MKQLNTQSVMILIKWTALWFIIGMFISSCQREIPCPYQNCGEQPVKQGYKIIKKYPYNLSYQGYPDTIWYFQYGDIEKINNNEQTVGTGQWFYVHLQHNKDTFDAYKEGDYFPFNPDTEKRLVNGAWEYKIWRYNPFIPMQDAVNGYIQLDSTGRYDIMIVEMLLDSVAASGWLRMIPTE